MERISLPYSLRLVARKTLELGWEGNCTPTLLFFWLLGIEPGSVQPLNYIPIPFYFETESDLVFC